MGSVGGGGNEKQLSLAQAVEAVRVLVLSDILLDSTITNQTDVKIHLLHIQQTKQSNNFSLSEWVRVRDRQKMLMVLLISGDWS